MDWKQATLPQLHLINSEFEDCPRWLKQLAQEEIERRRKKVHNKIPNKNKIGRV